VKNISLFHCSSFSDYPILNYHINYLLKILYRSLILLVKVGLSIAIIIIIKFIVVAVRLNLINYLVIITTTTTIIIIIAIIMEDWLI
jgi:hypothetical protein